MMNRRGKLLVDIKMRKAGAKAALAEFDTKQAETVSTLLQVTFCIPDSIPSG